MSIPINPFAEEDIATARTAGERWAAKTFAVKPGEEFAPTEVDAAAKIVGHSFVGVDANSTLIQRGLAFECLDAAQRRWAALKNPQPEPEKVTP